VSQSASQSESQSAGAGRPHELDASNLRVVRVGHGGNCSSVGSVVDTLFVSAAVGGAMLAAICAAMKAEPITVVGSAAKPGPARGTAAEPEPEPGADPNTPPKERP
jgi:hypothetical protein